MLRLRRQLQLLLIPCLLLTIAFVAVMPVAAASSCSTAWAVALKQSDGSAQFDVAGHRVVVDPCEKQSDDQQNDIIVNFALPLATGVVLAHPVISAPSIVVVAPNSRQGSPQQHTPAIETPPPIA